MTLSDGNPLSHLNLSEEEIERFRIEREASEERSRIRWANYERLQGLYDDGQLPTIIPQWHLNKQDIDLSKQGNGLETHHFSEGFTIIPNVPISTLLSNMSEENADFFRTEELFNDDTDLSTADILTHWENMEKLIPPTFMAMDKTVHEYCDADSKLIYPFDGKHRLHAACGLGATHVPIIVVNKQLAKIKGILSIA